SFLLTPIPKKRPSFADMLTTLKHARVREEVSRHACRKTSSTRCFARLKCRRRCKTRSECRGSEAVIEAPGSARCRGGVITLADVTNAALTLLDGVAERRLAERQERVIHLGQLEQPARGAGRVLRVDVALGLLGHDPREI